jgi:ERCC4-type nuclease
MKAANAANAGVVAWMGHVSSHCSAADAAMRAAAAVCVGALARYPRPLRAASDASRLDGMMPPLLDALHAAWATLASRVDAGSPCPACDRLSPPPLERCETAHATAHRAGSPAEEGDGDSSVRLSADEQFAAFMAQVEAEVQAKRRGALVSGVVSGADSGVGGPGRPHSGPGRPAVVGDFGAGGRGEDGGSATSASAGGGHDDRQYRPPVPGGVAHDSNAADAHPGAPARATVSRSEVDRFLADLDADLVLVSSSVELTGERYFPLSQSRSAGGRDNVDVHTAGARVEGAAIRSGRGPSSPHHREDGPAPAGGDAGSRVRGGSGAVNGILHAPSATRVPFGTRTHPAAGAPLAAAGAAPTSTAATVGALHTASGARTGDAITSAPRTASGLASSGAAVGASHTASGVVSVGALGSASRTASGATSASAAHAAGLSGVAASAAPVGRAARTASTNGGDASGALAPSIAPVPRASSLVHTGKPPLPPVPRSSSTLDAWLPGGGSCGGGGVEAGTASAAASTRSRQPPPPPPPLPLDHAAWRLVCVIDHREKGAKRDGEFFVNALTTAGVAAERRVLPLGDFLWIIQPVGDGEAGGDGDAGGGDVDAPVGTKRGRGGAGAGGGDAAAKRPRGKAGATAAKASSVDEGGGRGPEFLVGLVVERKTVSDLASSIMGGRYVDQKARLGTTGGVRVTYLVEGRPDSLSSRVGGAGGRGGITSDAILTAMRGTAVRDGFNVVGTPNQDATVQWLVTAHASLRHALFSVRPPAARRTGAAALAHLGGCRRAATRALGAPPAGPHAAAGAGLLRRPGGGHP